MSWGYTVTIRKLLLLLMTVQNDGPIHIDSSPRKKLENGSICDNSRAISRCSHKRLVETSVPSSSKQIGYDKHLWTDLQESMKSQFS